MLLPGPDLHCAGPLAIWRFFSIFLPNISADQKQSPIISERRAPGTVQYGKFRPCQRTNILKRLDESPR